eukprot:CAMPEP_0171123070 /NCGR_PEP_ID=MMETSP0766_2-20121228/106341_1 /TAXON_ID=439317 /ORGANISM="Gambierdiscus australes, Strain CAWD 149" /LENGTH=88 /DNA_ID=CAMNT_0011585929 /DNA_START=36 /DNA_END=299 /DNA_ORIENTATION=-
MVMARAGPGAITPTAKPSATPRPSKDAAHDHGWALCSSGSNSNGTASLNAGLATLSDLATGSSTLAPGPCTYATHGAANAEASRSRNM